MSTLEIDDGFNFVDAETLSVIDDCPEVAQNVRVALSIFPGESCVFPDAGIDWLSPAFRDERFASQVLEDNITAITGVDTVSNIRLVEGENRLGNFVFDVKVDGNIAQVSI